MENPFAVQRQEPRENPPVNPSAKPFLKLDGLLAGYENKSQDLPQHVRGYAQRLRTVILGFFAEHGAKDAKELFALLKSRKIKISRDRMAGFVRLLDEYEAALEKGEMPEMVEIGKIEDYERFVFAGENIFALNEDDDTRFGESEVSYYLLSDPERKWYFHNWNNRYAVDRDDGRILTVGINGKMSDGKKEVEGPSLPRDLKTAFRSGGNWYAVSGDEGEMERNLQRYARGKGWEIVLEWDVWELSSSSGLVPFKVDNGKVYKLDAYEYANEDEESTYVVKGEDGQKIASGLWRGYDGWLVRDGMVFFRKTTEQGTTFFRDDEPIFILEDQRKPTAWEIRKGVLRVALPTDDEKQVMYEIDLKLKDQPPKILSDFNFNSSSEERW